MKKCALFLVLFTLHLNAQLVQVYEPVKIVAFQNPMTPLIILDHFARNYPGITPVWGVENRNYTVRYTDPDNGLNRILTYDRHGTVIRVQSELRTMAYPETIHIYFLKKYPNETYKVWVSEDNEGNLGYYSKRKSRTIWFDKDGNYVSRRRLF